MLGVFVSLKRFWSEERRKAATGADGDTSWSDKKKNNKKFDIQSLCWSQIIVHAGMQGINYSGLLKIWLAPVIKAVIAQFANHRHGITHVWEKLQILAVIQARDVNYSTLRFWYLVFQIWYLEPNIEKRW